MQQVPCIPQDQSMEYSSVDAYECLQKLLKIEMRKDGCRYRHERGYKDIFF